MADQCTCCGGAGYVPDIVGDTRPCSRCRTEEFNAWAAARYPHPRNIDDMEGDRG